MRFLVTAGNTREMIDRVRDWGNIFTGNTGFAIARALAEVGEVTLLTSNRAHLEEAKSLKAAHPIHAVGFTSHAQLKAALAERVTRERFDGIFMTAAVADYAPRRTYAVLERRADPAHQGEEIWRVRDVQAEKVRSTHAQIAVLGERTEKLVDLFRREWGYRGLLVKFKLEVGLSRKQLSEIGQQSRRASDADFLVANTLEMVEGAGAGAYLLGEGVEEFVPRGELPARLVRVVEDVIRDS
jgi:phosphopantothenate---cysteine ligase (CTP)